MNYYHASLNPSLPSVITPTEKYESTKGGCPEPRFGDVDLGFPESDVPQIAFSKSPESGVFAVAQNVAHDSEDDIRDTKMYIYSTSQEPDVDISDCGYDFSVLEEIRYNKPVKVEKYSKITVPASVIRSIGELYGLGYKPPTLEEALKDEIERIYTSKTPTAAETSDLRKYIQTGLDMGNTEEFHIDFDNVASESIPIKRALKALIRSGKY